MAGQGRKPIDQRMLELVHGGEARTYPPLPPDFAALVEKYAEQMAKARQVIVQFCFEQTPRDRWEHLEWIDDSTIACSWPHRAGDRWVGHG